MIDVFDMRIFRLGTTLARLGTMAAVFLGGISASPDGIVVPTQPATSTSSKDIVVPVDSEALDSRPAGSDALDAIRAHEYPRAIRLAERAIDDIESTSNRYDTALVLPLVALGDALAALENIDMALGAYNRARHVIRVNAGLYTVDQVDIIYREAHLLANAKRYRDANDRHEYAYEILRREHGDDDPDFLGGIFALADWYMAVYNIFYARQLFNDALQISIAASPEYDEQQLRALRGIAKSYWNERYPPNDIPWSMAGTYPALGANSSHLAPGTVNSFANGERALLRAIRLVREDEGASSEDVAGAMLDLADWYLVFDKYNRAFPLYQHISGLLQHNDEALVAAFGEPIPLYLPLPRDPMKPSDALSDTTKEGLIELAVTITKRGFVSDIEMIRSEPGEIMDYRLRRSVRSARYRPKFTDDGHPVADGGARVIYTFNYYPTERSEAAHRENEADGEDAASLKDR